MVDEASSGHTAGVGTGAHDASRDPATAGVPAGSLASTSGEGRAPEPPVSRRGFLGAAAGAALGGFAAACGGGGSGGVDGAPGVVTRPNVQWRLASSYTRTLDALYGAVDVLASVLSDLTDGRFQIRPYAAGELVPALQVLDAAEQGTVQVAHTAAYYYTGKHPAFAFATCLPFGLTAWQQKGWLAEGGGKELMDELFGEFGLLHFYAGNTGAQMGGWFRRELRSLADLQGLTMRIPGIGGEVMSRLGVTVQVLGGADLYPALERGAIDAAEWVGPYDDERLGLHQVAPYYYMPGWWEPSGALTFVVNRNAWEQLPAAYRRAFEAAAAVAGNFTESAYDARNPQALARLVASGTQLRRFPNDILQAARTETNDLMESHAASNALYRRIYGSWQAFREAAYRWSATAEYEYMRFAYPSLMG